MANWKNAFTLMRIPFSVFLMPVYWFALSVSPAPVIILWKALLVFLILHLLVYPASNGYNSFFDKDEDSIGGLVKPPEVTPQLFYLVIIFDVLAVSLSLILSVSFAAMILIYLLVSKAYSYDKIRLKKYPVTGALTVILFQGMFTFLMVQQGSGMNWDAILQKHNLLYAMVSTLFLAGSYPLTQVYQHDEDQKRGDYTLSLMLGIKGSFIFAATAFSLAAALLFYLFHISNNHLYIMIFITGSLPVIVYFSGWLKAVLSNQQAVNFKKAMRMNMISSISLSLVFITILCQKVYCFLHF